MTRKPTSKLGCNLWHKYGSNDPHTFLNDAYAHSNDISHIFWRCWTHFVWNIWCKFHMKSFSWNRFLYCRQTAIILFKKKHKYGCYIQTICALLYCWVLFDCCSRKSWSSCCLVAREYLPHTHAERKPRWRERCVLESTKAKHAVKDVQNTDLDAILYCVPLIRHNSFEFSMLLLWLHTWNVRFAVFVRHEDERTAKNHRTTLLTCVFSMFSILCDLLTCHSKLLSLPFFCYPRNRGSFSLDLIFAENVLR